MPGDVTSYVMLGSSGGLNYPVTGTAGSGARQTALYHRGAKSHRREVTSPVKNSWQPVKHKHTTKDKLPR